MRTPTTRRMARNALDPEVNEVQKCGLAAVVLLAVLASVAQAGGFDGTVITLVDSTSIRVKLNIPHEEMRECVKAGGFEPPGILAGEPGLRVTYFDHDLLLLLPIEPGHEVEIGEVGKVKAMVAAVLFRKPVAFDKRWPLVGDPEPGVYYIVAYQRAGRPMAALVTAKPPHRATPIPTRLPDWGQTPGAMVGQGEVHPYVTQIGKGCTFGVGLVAGERIVACDLVR